MMDFHGVFPEINLNPVRVTCPEELDRSMALKNTLLKFRGKRQLVRRKARFHGEGEVCRSIHCHTALAANHWLR